MNRFITKISENALLLSWLFVIFVALFIFVMSARSGFEIDNNTGIFTMIKHALSAAAFSLTGHEVDVSPIGHFCEYLIFGIALQNALSRTCRTKISSTLIIVLAIVIASTYGITDELHQIFIPGRSCDPADWLVDTIAAALGAFLFHMIQKRRN